MLATSCRKVTISKMSPVKLGVTDELHFIFMTGIIIVCDTLPFKPTEQFQKPQGCQSEKTMSLNLNPTEANIQGCAAFFRGETISSELCWKSEVSAKMTKNMGCGEKKEKKEKGIVYLTTHAHKKTEHKEMNPSPYISLRPPLPSQSPNPPPLPSFAGKGRTAGLK